MGSKTQCYRCNYLLASEAAEFYMWRFLEAELKDISELPLGKKHAEYLADAMFDYLCIASLGEARHAYNHCLDAYVNLPVGVTRHAVYQEAHLYKPKQFLPVLSKLFNECRWEGAFGGKAWGKGVDMALKYLRGELNPVLFVDSAIWLHHNTGVIFNKPLIFKDGGRWVFRRVLDAKRHCKTPLEFVSKFYMSRSMQLFLQEFFGISCRRNYLSMLDRGYRKIEFKGEKELILYERKEEKEEKSKKSSKPRVKQQLS